MKALNRYAPFFTSALLMWLLLYLLYPHYQYYVDPDGTAYLTIAKRYANGDILRATNGYWSPWACWLAAGLIKIGFAPIPSGVIVNAAGATGVLFISQAFFLRFKIAFRLQWLLNATLCLFLCYAVFDQSFDDLWECFFLLLALRIIIASNFGRRPVLWAACGIVGALAYFAKAYSFPFFILNTVCCTYFICKDSKPQWLKVSFFTVAAMVICSLPWIVALHNKYGVWTTSTAGPLNTSWYLVGHPYWREGLKYLIPPVYPDSPYYWEDPYYANGNMPHAWDSLSLLGLQVLRAGYNLWKLLKSMVLLSFFFPFIVLALARFIVTSKQAEVTEIPRFTVALSFLLFPLGYILVNFEPRYIWYMLPLSMLAGTLFIVNHLSSNKGIMKFIPFLFAASYLIYPVVRMQQMYDEGKHEYTVAGQMKQLGIHGSFTSLAKPGKEAQQIERLAYFSGNQLYSIPRPDSVSHNDLLQEIRRYHIRYFFAYGGYGARAFADENGHPFPELTNGKIEGLKVYAVNP